MDNWQAEKVHGSHNDSRRGRNDAPSVAGDPDNHLRAWRKFRGMTQQELADAVDPPTTKSVIAALESGQNGLSAKWLRRLAPALKTTPGFLLDHDPDDLDSAWTEATEDVPRDRRAEAIRILKILSGKD